MSYPKTSSEVQLRLPAKPSKSTFNKLVAVSFLIDAVCVAGALILAYLLRFETSLTEWGTPDRQSLNLPDYTGHIAMGTIIMMAVLMRLELYTHGSFLSLHRTLRTIAKSAIIWLVAYLSLSLVLKFDPPISRVYCGIGLGAMMLILPAWRWVLWRIVRHEKFARRLRQRAIVIGWSRDLAKAWKVFGGSVDRPFDLCGVIKPPSGDIDTPDSQEIEMIGRYEDLPFLLKMRVCDIVLVADNAWRSQELMDLAFLCEKEMVQFKLVPTGFRVLLSGLHLESIAGMPVLGISRLPLHSFLNQHVKRAVDVAGAIVGITLALPMMLTFGALIWLESPGPIFYRQRRMGIDGRLFDMFKLRSMKMNAEAGGSPGWTVKDDPRVLRVGKFMRRWNIDEIPQFWNVLRGDMSLVGPRPERPELIARFKEIIPHYNARHHIKPGLTGWAQVNGLRGDTDLTERVRYDLHYIENWNVLFDFHIMLMTFFKRENAC